MSLLNSLPVASAITIRRAAPDEAAILAQLGRETFAETFGASYAPHDLAAFFAGPFSDEYMKAELAVPANAAWIAIADEGAGAAGLAGFCLVGPAKFDLTAPLPKPGSVRRLYLRAAFQGRGIGTRLLELGIAWLEAENYHPLFLSVDAENYGAQRLYARYGFVKIGEFAFMVGSHADREFLMEQKSTPEQSGS